jgi:class 3 adenylate cyclase/tetratricopeptide (TPR) repeat protein
VVCSSCGRENRDDARFCDSCGTRLTPGPAPSVNLAMPTHLADKIRDTKRALEGERKQVTVLFADVRGSMDITEDIDAEEWRRILNRFYEILTEGVHRFEGTINQYTGDGIMAIFGAPIAHEDHARRACFAALHLTDTLGLYARELRRERGLSFSVRIGLNSGEVVVGAIGPDLHMEYTAVGHTVGLAARMEQLAAPGTAYVTDRTIELAGAAFDVEDLGTFDVKGVREAVRVYELRGVGAGATRFDLSRARGLSRFVGRRAERRELERALEDAESGRGRIVGVAGEAGVGKSRLCHEFIEHARGSGIRVFVAHGQPHAGVAPFRPILELLRGYFAVDDVDGPVAARQKIAGSLLLLDESFRDLLPLVFDFLGVPDPDLPHPQLDPATRMEKLYRLLAHLIRARSDRGPALVLLEDLQWFDAGSEAFLTHLVDAVPGTRTMLLVNFRPEYTPTWMARFYTQLTLGPLDADAIAELLEHRLGTDSSLQPLAAYIERRTGGNPFFIEEVVASLIGSGALVGDAGAYRLAGSVGELAVPPTVQAVIAARLDRLGEREKSVLQTASVIGTDFAQRVLQAVADYPVYEIEAALRALVDAEFLVEVASYPERELAFRHPLTQEVAYRSQLGERRRRTHAAVARAIADVHVEKLDEQAAVLAHHWEEAGDALEAARWHRRAAEWASHNDTASGLRHWRAVRNLIGAYPSDEKAESLALAACLGVLNLGPRHGLTEAEAQALFDEGRTLAQHRGDERSLARLLLVFARVRGVSGHVDAAATLSLEAGKLAQRVGLRGLRLAAAVNLSTWATQFGDIRRSLEIVDEALRDVPTNLRVGAEHLGYSPYIWLAMHRGRLLTYMGRTSQAFDALDRALHLAQDNGEVEIVCWAHQGHTDLAVLLGDPGAALAHARLAVETAEKIGTLFSAWSAHHSLGRALTLAGDLGEAVAALSHALTVMRRRRTGLHLQVLVLGSLAEAHLARGETDRARFYAEEAVDATERDTPLAVRARTILARARRSSGHGNPEIEERDLRRGLGVLSRSGYRSLEPPLHTELAELARARGDDAAAEAELAAAAQFRLEMDVASGRTAAPDG